MKIEFTQDVNGQAKGSTIETTDAIADKLVKAGVAKPIRTTSKKPVPETPEDAK